MAKAAFPAARKGRSARQGGGRTVASKAARPSAFQSIAWAPPSPPPPQIMPLDPHFPIVLPCPSTPRRAAGGATGVLREAGGREEATLTSDCGAWPSPRAFAALCRRRAGKPFEMRGATDHWSPG